MKITELIGKEITSISWNDLETLRQSEPIVFYDVESIEIICEWVKFKGNDIKSFIVKEGAFRYSFFYTIKKELHHHKPSMIQPVDNKETFVQPRRLFLSNDVIGFCNKFKDMKQQRQLRRLE